MHCNPCNNSSLMAKDDLHKQLYQCNIFSIMVNNYLYNILHIHPDKCCNLSIMLKNHLKIFQLHTQFFVFNLHSCCKCRAALLTYLHIYLSYSSFYLINKILYLQDLIGYYTHKSDLLKVERLNQPVPPPEAVNDQKRAIAILPYTKMPGM